MASNVNMLAVRCIRTRSRDAVEAAAGLDTPFENVGQQLRNGTIPAEGAGSRTGIVSAVFVISQTGG
jgi:hypothetical protein